MRATREYDQGVDQRLFERLRSQLSSGRVILFLGAGFSRDAVSINGEMLPGVESLRDALWKVAFGDAEFDGSGLDDVYESAVMQARKATVLLMKERLTVDPDKLPDEYRIWLSFPWHRVYTLNIDNLEEAAERRFDLPRGIRSLSALRDSFPAADGSLLWVHMNGDLVDLPDVTFSQRQYGERQATWESWYANLAREMQHHPVLFVGTSLDEPPLWQYVEARGHRSYGRELRPGSYLVTASLGLARRTALRNYNIDFVKAKASDFCREQLVALVDAAEEGQRALKQGAGQALAASLVRDLTDMVGDAADDHREFLLGREPRWSDVTEGYAIERAFDRALPAEIEVAAVRLVLLTGTAGSGKSTTAMRLVLAYQADGKRVGVLNTMTDARLPQIRAAVGVSAADVLLVDDVGRFGRAAWGLLNDLLDANDDLLVVSCIRSAPYQRLEMPELVQTDQRALQKTVPPLEDADIDGLIDALARANRLGELRGKSGEERRQAFAVRAGRQLLVAMIEATSGLRFDEKVESEARQLDPVSGLVYAVLAIANSFHIGLKTQELLTACGGDGADVVRSIDELERQHLVVRRSGQLYLRHTVIAERAFRYYRESRQLSEPLRGLVFSLASVVAPGRLRQSRQGRVLIRLLNHAGLMRLLSNADSTIDLASVRQVYEEVETLLSQDHHYWLQRGSLETEQGSLDLAKNFLDQARSLAPEDPYVQSEWAYMSLKGAYMDASGPGAAEQANAALAELRDVVSRRGREDSYPYHILGSQGLAWAKRAPLATDERVRLMLELRDVVSEGSTLHPSNRELQTLRADLDREYMMLAVSDRNAPD